MKKTTRYMTVSGIAAFALSAAVIAGVNGAGVKGEAVAWIEPELSLSTNDASFASPSYSGTTFSVWANGRDIKDNKKTPENEERRYKTGSYQHIAMSTGGKWNAVVTSTSVKTVDEFIKMVDAKGKFTDPAASENKQIASAKIKDGEIVVTAGKKAGNVNVWVYETNKSGMVYIPMYDVVPKMYTAEVKVSSAAPVLAAEGEIKDGVLQGKNAISKLDLIFDKTPNTIQSTSTFSLGDKKEAADENCTYSISYNNADKTTTASVVSALISSDKSTVYITPVSVGKTTLLVTNDQSGKAAKVSVEVKNKYPVLFNADAVTVSDITKKNEPVELKPGDEIIDGSSVKVTAREASGVQITVDGKSVKSGGTVKMSGKAIDIKAGKLHPVTITGTDKNNAVKDGSKALKSGDTRAVGTKLTLVIEKGGTAVVTSGSETPTTYVGDGTHTFEFEVAGDTSVAFTKPAAPTNP